MPRARELLLFGPAGQGGCRSIAAGDAPGNLIEVAGADETLVLGRLLAVVLTLEFGLLQPGVGAHAAMFE